MHLYGRKADQGFYRTVREAKRHEKNCESDV